MPFGKDLRSWLMRRVTPFVVLSVSLAVTALITFFVYQTSAARDQARFQALVMSMEEEVRSRVTVYATILAATRGFIHADTPPLSRAEFGEFVSELGLASNYPGIQGLGYTVRVPRERVPELEAFARQQGFSDFRVWPESAEPFVHSILFLEPLAGRNAAAIGFNMHSEATRREAMHRAVASGESAISGPVALAQETAGPKQAGVLMFMPVFSGSPTREADRVAQLMGFAFIVMRADNFLAAIVGRRQMFDLALRIYDGDAAAPATLLHEDAELGATGVRREPRFRERRAIAAGGRTWTIEYWSRRAFESSQPRNFGVLVGSVGLVVSLLLFMAARLLYGAWGRAAAQSEDLRTSQAALATRERELDIVLTNTPDIIARFDRNHRHVYINAAVEHFTGLKPEAYLGKTSAELGVPAHLAELGTKAMNRVFETGEPSTTVFEIEIGKGEKTLQSSLVPERGPTGRVETVLAVTRDITELKLAAARLQSAARHSSLLADASRSFVEGRLDEASVASGALHILTTRMGDGAAIYKYDAETDQFLLLALAHREPAQEKVLQDSLLAQPLPRPSTQLIARVIQSGTPIFLEDLAAWTSRPDVPAEYADLLRKLALTSLMLLPLKAEGRSEAVLILGSTQQMSRDDFETVTELANRTALALENARLYQAAQRAVRLRDEFLSIASHELKTPLTPLQLQMESLERLVKRHEAVTPERLESIARITVRQVQRLTALVANLLDISRISEGHLALEPEPCDLGAIVDEAVERFATESERVGSTVTVTKNGALGGLWDRLRIEQVVTNLISNALKYGAGKPVEVYVTQQGASVELRVVDHGIGLDPDFIPKMFERFARGVSGRSYGGLGLGLFIVHQIVTGHGGAVAAHSAAGATELRVVLPAVPGPGL